MNAKDLQLGNYIYCSNLTQFPMYVVGIVGDTLYLDFDGNEGLWWEAEAKDIVPIEVTEELLEKIGFERNEMYGSNDRCFDVRYDMQLKSCFLEVNQHSNSVGKDWYCHIDNDCHSTIGGFDFQYIHQLQNGIRLIIGQDLEINL